MLWSVDSPSLRTNWPDWVAHSKWATVVARWIEWMLPMRWTRFVMGLERVSALRIEVVAFVVVLRR